VIDGLGVAEADAVGVAEADAVGVEEADAVGVEETDALGVGEAVLHSPIRQTGPPPTAWAAGLPATLILMAIVVAVMTPAHVAMAAFVEDRIIYLTMPSCPEEYMSRSKTYFAGKSLCLEVCQPM
jgi:hypothetical protein